MWIENKIFAEDMENFSNVDYINWQKLKNKTIFITGATGLIGFAITSALIYTSRKRGLNIRIIALTRNIANGKKKFSEVLSSGNELSFVEGDVNTSVLDDTKIDYIIHGASVTSSKDFVTKPVETMLTAIEGTRNMLELARVNKVLGFVYMSSMEVYGNPQKGHKVKEDEIGTFSPLVLRNSYPLSKLVCENLCAGYAQEYGVPTKIARLTQTFGPGIQNNDSRIFAEIIKNVTQKQNIVLKTHGETEHCYLYTTDAASAIVLLLLEGKVGEAYTIANEATYCSISEMAHTVANMYDINVQYELVDISNLGYASTKYIDLNTTKLQAIGWHPTTGLAEMFKKSIEVIQCQKS